MDVKRKAEYMRDFARFSPEKRREHLIIAVAFLLRLASRQEPLALDDPDVIDGEYTEGGAA